MEKEKKPLEYGLILVLFSLLVILCFLQVLFRFVLNLPLAWTEELSRYVFITLIYAGASAAAINSQHVRVELIDGWIPKKWRWISDVTMRLICATMNITISLFSITIIKNAYISTQLSASLQIPMWIIYSIVALMFLLLTFRFLQSAWRCFQGRNAWEDLK